VWLLTIHPWLDPRLWSFGKPSENGIFYIYRRSCKSIIHNIGIDQKQHKWAGSFPFRKGGCNAAGIAKSCFKNIGTTVVQLLQFCFFFQHIFDNDNIDIRLQKKAVFLVTDLADFQLNSGNSGLPLLSDRLFLKSIVHMLSRFDLDLQEKV
jgi:hypothetical protein